MTASQEPDRWLQAKKPSAKLLTLGPRLSEQYHHDPRRILRDMILYKWASKLIGPGKFVLDLGCGEGLGTYTLAVENGKAHGVDHDVSSAHSNFGHDARVSFGTELPAQSWDAIVHIRGGTGGLVDWQWITTSLVHDGVFVVSLPGQAADSSRELNMYFGHVFCFSILEESIRIGRTPGCDMIALGCRPKRPTGHVGCQTL